MLDDCLIESRPGARSRKPLTTMVSTMLHVVIAVALLLIPLFQTQVLPAAEIAPRLAPPPVHQELRIIELPKTAAVQAVQHVVVPDLGTLIAPTVIPPRLIAVIDEPAGPAPAYVPATRGSSDMASLLRGVEDRIVDAAPLPPAPVAAPAVSAPIRLGGSVQQANLIRQVKPVYPTLARSARIQGIVVLEAMITKEGTVDSLHVISGHQFLVQAAIDAVRQWQYRPTMLNGEPVEVVTTITVSFSLQ